MAFNSWSRLGTRAAVTAVVGVEYWAGTDKRKSHCAAASKKVLIVGCGLTGALTARQLSQYSKGNIDIDVVERASYPAGRFGARASYGGAVADLGAQVLSTVNPDDFRASGGHGVTQNNLRTGQSIVNALLQKNLLKRVPGSALGETDERMIWEGLWEHYMATKSMSNVLEAILPDKLVPKFGVRIDGVMQVDNGKLQVNGVCRSSLSEDQPFNRAYDAVILCIPAPDALYIKGIISFLDEPSRQVLQNVGYDSRTCEAHFFDPRMRSALVKAFLNSKGTTLEMSIDEENYPISYISWQDPRRDVASEDTQTPCAITVHSKAGHEKEMEEAYLDQMLSQLTGLSPEMIGESRLQKKSIGWQTAQMIRPMEAVVDDPPPNSSWQCLSVFGGKLVLAGDFMTQSSFVGCVASADAAAETVFNSLR